jgi:hypothetical protein
MSAKLLLKLVAGDCPTEVDDYMAMLCALLDYKSPGPEMLDDVQALWEVLAKSGLVQFKTVSLSSAIRAKLDSHVEKDVKAANFGTLFKSVVVVHLMECQVAFAACAATARPNQWPTALMTKAASNLDIFVMQFNSAAMGMRAEEKDMRAAEKEQFNRMAAELETLKRRADGSFGGGKRRPYQAQWPLHTNWTPPWGAEASAPGHGLFGPNEASWEASAPAWAPTPPPFPPPYSGGKGGGKGGGKSLTPCRDFSRGACNRGDGCRFTHWAGEDNAALNV